MDPSTSAEELAARESIRELRASYAWCVDESAWDRWERLFAPAARFEPNPSQTIQGRAAIGEFGATVIDDVFVDSRHRMHNPLLDVDGDEATGRWYVTVLGLHEDETAEWHAGRYEDQYCTVDGEWLFERIIVDIDIRSERLYEYKRVHDEERGMDVLRVRDLDRER